MLKQHSRQQNFYSSLSLSLPLSLFLFRSLVNKDHLEVLCTESGTRLATLHTSLSFCSMNAPSIERQQVLSYSMDALIHYVFSCGTRKR